MKVSEATDSELSLFIAEKLEPLVKIGDPKEYALAYGVAKGTPCWRTMRTGIVADLEDDTFHWWQRDMVTDPAMTVMLLEKMTESKWGWELVLSSKIVCIQHRGGRTHSADNLDGQSLGRVIASAWALANGWPERDV